MKTALSGMSSGKAKNELKQFSVAGLVLSVLSLFVFWWLAIAGLAFSARGLLLTYHKANKSDAIRYRSINGASLLMALISIALYES